MILDLILAFLQVGAFSKRENAEKLAAELQKLGYDTLIKKVEV